LYRRLESRLGPVIVANEGEELVGWAATDPYTGRPRLEVSLPGEYYRISCPFCNDTRHRLYINHRWGLYVPEFKSDNLFLAHCFNENCLAEPGRALQLRDVVFSDFARGRAPDPVLRGRRPEVAPCGGARPPGPFVQALHQLEPDHTAVLYLRGRGYDTGWLGRTMRVGFCPISYPEYPTAQGRIIIPVYQGGAYAGWQARYPHEGEPPGGSPKYYTMPGMKVSQLLYNLDTARQSPFGVVCEGPTDVWAFGPEAVALYGNKVSAAQARLIGSAWGQGTVIILLDGDAPGPARAAHDALAGRVRQTVVVELPPDRDPGDFPRQELRQLVFAAALRQGADLGAAAAL
jgi:hypothetical protein